MTASPYPLLAPKLEGYSEQLSNHVVREVLFAKEETLNCTYQQSMNSSWKRKNCKP
jgi:hypothetical protein